MSNLRLGQNNFYHQIPIITKFKDKYLETKHNDKSASLIFKTTGTLPNLPIYDITLRLFGISSFHPTPQPRKQPSQ